jgi:hypothetical protein
MEISAVLSSTLSLNRSKVTVFGVIEVIGVAL